MTTRILVGDALTVLRTLPSESVHMAVCSPPYYGLRRYIEDDSPEKQFEIGLEATPELWVAAMVAVFREVRRVLRADGTLWLNIGDSYAGSWGNQGRKSERGTQRPINGEMLTPVLDGRYPALEHNTGKAPPGCKPKDLIGAPWMLAFALRADGWYLRSEIIWSKPNPMPESVQDRPTKAHEQLFLLSKSRTYYYDADAIREAPSDADRTLFTPGPQTYNVSDTSGREKRNHGLGFGKSVDGSGRNKRSVWTVATEAFPESHFATYPTALIEPCIKAGSSERGVCPECGAPWVRVVERGGLEQIGTNVRPAPNKGHIGVSGERAANMTRDGFTPNHQRPRNTTGWRPSCKHEGEPVPATVLDPFFGAGTTGLVADRLNRDCIGVELNEQYAAMAQRRISGEAPMFAEVEVA